MRIDPLPATGEIVRIRETRWRVLRCDPHGPCAVVDVAAADGRATVRAKFLLPFERVDRVPAVARPRRVRVTEWRSVARRALADALPSWWSLRTAARARMSLLPFQLEPALSVNRAEASRLLIADAVGLGKTVQAGLIVGETLDRTPDAHVLVVSPASLRAQWDEELRTRFALAPRVLDAAGLAAAAADLPAGANPWQATPLAITSIDFVKRPDVARSLEPIVWDLIVFDEAHLLAGRSDRTAAAAVLARRARVVVLLSATPHSGNQEEFARLCRIGELAGDPPLRLFRRSAAVLGARPSRREVTLLVRPTAAEARMHAGLDEYEAMAAREGGATAGAHLVLLVLRRRAASSAASLERSLGRRLALLQRTTEPFTPQCVFPFVPDDEGDEAPLAALEAPLLADRRGEIDVLLALRDRAASASRQESKLGVLRRLLRRSREPAIVFTQYRDTLETVAAALGGDLPLLHGGLTLRERQAAARRFTHGDAPALLATDAASEGLNLHHRCRTVVHLELPWTPLRLEQRTGRVDRLGQDRRVRAVRLIAGGTPEEQLAERLRHRSTQIEQSAPLSCAVAHIAVEEGARIQLARTLDAGAARCLAARPVVTRARRREAAGPRAITALRVPFLDPDGWSHWEWLMALAVSIPGDPPFVDADALRLLLGTRVAAAIESWRRAAAARAEREHAIVRDVRDTQARMSAALLQRGLFDRRGERASAAQQQLLASVLAATAGRLASLERAAHIHVGDPQSVFTVLRA